VGCSPTIIARPHEFLTRQDIAPATALGQTLAALVMILGYGILAVPTGIVTAELARDAYKPFSIQACPACSAEGHDADAVYCKYCGAKLYEVGVGSPWHLGPPRLRAPCDASPLPGLTLTVAPILWERTGPRPARLVHEGATCTVLRSGAPVCARSDLSCGVSGMMLRPYPTAAPRLVVPTAAHGGLRWSGQARLPGGCRRSNWTAPSS
jgi:hypothetical protein